ncbi:phosphatase PAP2 family protein [Polaribacter sp.]|nr:phosphatase PAP2 family protein [Polaribacter sp.]MDA9092874.1 phosphatase PAP2 family protein [Polaribacter sp.]MDB4009924.1 phosphatase PAP2 family protein [Polaribacter sp.]
MNKLLIILLFIPLNSFGQNKKNDTIHKIQNIKFNYKSIIIPTVLIGYGFIGIENDALKLFNYEIQEELKEHTYNNNFKIDDVSLFVPSLSVYGLNALGINGKNNFKDRTIILGTASLIMGSTVGGIKKLTSIERPDGSNKFSFPSGHTATAFMGAEFLYQEYKDVSIWYGISGYLVATGTGFLRMYNNRHWFTDIVTGAGIGILSTKIAYWIHPFVKKTLFKDKKEINGLVIPFYNGKEYGLGLSMLF